MIADAVANNGPVSICYHVALDFWFYKKGVYKKHVNDHMWRAHFIICYILVHVARMVIKMLIMLVREGVS